MDQLTNMKKKSDNMSDHTTATSFQMKKVAGQPQIGWATLLRGGPIIALLLLFVYFSFASPHFAALSNFKNVAQQNAYLIIIAVGQTLIITGAGIDLSVGAVMAVSASIMAVLATQQISLLGMKVGPLNVWVAILIGLGVGIIAGFVNGLIITKGRIPDFIATLGMMEVARGIALLVTGGLPIPSHLTATKLKGYLPEAIIWMGGREIFGFPTGPLVAVVMVIIGWVLLSQTVLGRSIFAIGGNKEGARVSGLKVDRIKIATYVFMGIMAAVAGIVLTGRMNSANALMGTGVELNCIAAVVIGGTNLFGGEGTIIGSLIGAIIMGVLGNGLNLLNVSAFWQRVVMGIVIIVVVVFDQWRRRRFGS
jgi:ribose/xylose/arabinose/galactoside ABC-type transport system permease subunit